MGFHSEGAAMVKQGSTFTKAKLWFYAWAAVSIAYAVPVGLRAYDRVIEVTHAARARLIVQHELWEQDPNYRGSPELWTRLASRMLTDRQLLRRVRDRYGAAAHQIELEYRSDLAIAQAEVIVTAAAVWGIPVMLLYGIGCLALRRQPRKPPPPSVPPRSSYDESRYRPPGQAIPRR
jgi:hypothetical protein